LKHEFPIFRSTFEACKAKARHGTTRHDNDTTRQGKTRMKNKCSFQREAKFHNDKITKDQTNDKDNKTTRQQDNKTTRRQNPNQASGEKNDIQ
jgi:hypothetical protein